MVESFNKLNSKFEGISPAVMLSKIIVFIKISSENQLSRPKSLPFCLYIARGEYTKTDVFFLFFYQFQTFLQLQEFKSAECLKPQLCY